MSEFHENKDVFLSLECDRTTGSVAWYRLPAEMKDFLNICREKHGDIEAIILDRKDDDTYGFNIGFSLPEKK